MNENFLSQIREEEKNSQISRITENGFSTDSLQESPSHKIFKPRPVYLYQTNPNNGFSSLPAFKNEFDLGQISPSKSPLEQLKYSKNTKFHLFQNHLRKGKLSKSSQKKIQIKYINLMKNHLNIIKSKLDQINIQRIREQLNGIEKLRNVLNSTEISDSEMEENLSDNDTIMGKAAIYKSLYGKLPGEFKLNISQEGEYKCPRLLQQLPIETLLPINFFQAKQKFTPAFQTQFNYKTDEISPKSKYSISSCVSNPNNYKIKERKVCEEAEVEDISGIWEKMSSVSCNRGGRKRKRVEPKVLEETEGELVVRLNGKHFTVQRHPKSITMNNKETMCHSCFKVFKFSQLNYHAFVSKKCNRYEQTISNKLELENRRTNSPPTADTLSEPPLKRIKGPIFIIDKMPTPIKLPTNIYWTQTKSKANGEGESANMIFKITK